MIQQSFLSNRRIVCAAVIGCIVVFLGISFIGFDARDPSFIYDTASAAPAVVNNYAGQFGAHVAALMLYLFGSASFILLPLLVLLGGIVLQIRTFVQAWSRLFGLTMLTVGFASLSKQLNISLHAGVYPGGCVGALCTSWLLAMGDAVIAYAAVMVMLCAGLVLIVRFSWVGPFCRLLECAWGYAGGPVMIARIRSQCGALHQRIMKAFSWSKTEPVDELESLVNKVVCEASEEDLESRGSRGIFEDPFWQQYGAEKSDVSSIGFDEEDELDEDFDDEWSIEIDLDDLDEESGELIYDQSEEEPEQEISLKEDCFALPDRKIFPIEGSKKEDAERAAAAQIRAGNLEEKLSKFGIKGEVVSITVGPVVTLFEYAPESDVKVSKILALEDDLALALEALSLRILAPIPGRPVVGFEVANATREIVTFADLVTSETFVDGDHALPMVIGRDTAGDDIIGDLAGMPHLLVAGSTGSGKSVALNAMLTSLLCSRTPDELNLILIDPKRLELAPFADIAHLVFPIVTDVKRAPLVLRWAVKTMEERYDAMAEAGVRNVTEYHKKFGITEMPYLVVVIDELADLMMTVGKDVEELIARLAQMARAAGIHLIVATQRPSVDVITGLIKVNFPSRMAFKVTSKVDSRTILDSAGAEKLLGKGDMLFLDARGMMQRVHGAYVLDREIDGVVAHIKEQREVVYQELDALISTIEDVHDEDEMYDEVCAFVEELEEVSISLLQRKFRIGYNRSARLIDTLESRGVVMPADGGKMRKVREKL